MNKRPVSILIVACLYLAVGCVGFVYHFRDLAHPDGISIELTEALAVLAGVFLLRRSNWARWLAIAWMAFHVAMSVVPPFRGLIVHALFFALIAWLLFRPEAGQYFRGAAAQ
jgi:hypothetical protein